MDGLTIANYCYLSQQGKTCHIHIGQGDTVDKLDDGLCEKLLGSVFFQCRPYMFLIVFYYKLGISLNTE